MLSLTKFGGGDVLFFFCCVWLGEDLCVLGSQFDSETGEVLMIEFLFGMLLCSDVLHVSVGLFCCNLKFGKWNLTGCEMQKFLVIFAVCLHFWFVLHVTFCMKHSACHLSVCFGAVVVL